MYGSFYSIMAWHPALLQIGNAMLTEPFAPENRYYLDFCLDEHVRLSLQFPVAIAVLEGILAMATEKKIIPLSVAQKKLEEAYANQARKDKARGSSSKEPLDRESTLVVDRSRALTDYKHGQASVISQGLRDQLMFNEFIADRDI